MAPEQHILTDKIKTLDTELLTRLLLLARVGECLLDHNDIRFIV